MSNIKVGSYYINKFNKSVIRIIRVSKTIYMLDHSDIEVLKVKIYDYRSKAKRELILGVYGNMSVEWDKISKLQAELLR